MNWFRIEEGAIVRGNLEKDIPRNKFLRTDKEYADFELRLKFKMLNSDAANGGIQFRSQPVSNNHEMIGYQADIISWKWVALYDESRRNKFLGTELRGKEAKETANKDDWNALTIRCEDPRVRIWINDIQTLNT